MIDSYRHILLRRLVSKNLIERIDAIRDLPKLSKSEAILIVDELLGVPNNIGMKIEALRITPCLAENSTIAQICDIFERSLSDSELEVARAGLLALREVVPDFVSVRVFEKVGSLLNVSDTDLQYEAVITLTHLRKLVSPHLFIAYLRPLESHPNSVLAKAATDACRSPL